MNLEIPRSNFTTLAACFWAKRRKLFERVLQPHFRELEYLYRLYTPTFFVVQKWCRIAQGWWLEFFLVNPWFEVKYLKWLHWCACIIKYDLYYLDHTGVIPGQPPDQPQVNCIVMQKISLQNIAEKIKSVKSDLFLEWGWTQVIPLSRIWANVFILNSQKPFTLPWDKISEGIETQSKAHILVVNEATRPRGTHMSDISCFLLLDHLKGIQTQF